MATTEGKFCRRPIERWNDDPIAFLDRDIPYQGARFNMGHLTFDGLKANRQQNGMPLGQNCGEPPGAKPLPPSRKVPILFGPFQKRGTKTHWPTLATEGCRGRTQGLERSFPKRLLCGRSGEYPEGTAAGPTIRSPRGYRCGGDRTSSVYRGEVSGDGYCLIVFRRKDSP